MQNPAENNEWARMEAIDQLPLQKPASQSQLCEVADYARDILYGDIRHRVHMIKNPIRGPHFAVTYIDGPSYVTLTARDSTKRPDIDIMVEQRYFAESELVIVSLFEIINSTSFMRRKTDINKSVKYKTEDEFIDLDATIPITKPKLWSPKAVREDYRMTKRMSRPTVDLKVEDYLFLLSRLTSYNPNERVYATGDEVIGE